MQFIDVQSALLEMSQKTSTLPTETVPIEDALGRTLAEDIVSPIAVPSFDNSAMDGVAFRLHDLSSGTLQLVGTVAAGDEPITEPIAARTAMKIMTGAPLPAGCDCVVMREYVSERDGVISIESTPQRGDHIRTEGSYVAVGETVRNPGDVIDPGTVSLLASFGVTHVSVVRKPVVTVLTTGDELVPIDQTPGPGQIRNSNAWMMRALFQSIGIDAHVPAIVPDDQEFVKAAFEQAIRSSDLVVSIGGVSVGDFDFVQQTIENLCDDVSFWKVKMKPGKPLTHGVANGTHLLGLPGNPMSAFVSFYVFAKPLVLALQGRRNAWLPTVFDFEVAHDLRSTPKRREYIVGSITSGKFTRLGDQSSGNLAAMASCNALGIVEEGESGVAAGETLQVLDLRS